MNLIRKFRRYIKKLRLQKLRKHGMQFEDDLSLMSWPDFGSEPYNIKIGKHVRICSGVKFITHDGSTWVFRDKERYQHVVRFGIIEIRDNCFIGDNVTILPNVIIGENSIIGTGAVVAKDIPAGSGAVGVPAHVISTTKEFAEKCLIELPEYNHEEYFRRPQYWKKYIAQKRREQGINIQ